MAVFLGPLTREYAVPHSTLPLTKLPPPPPTGDSSAGVATDGGL
jgi:hypothetical protein